MNRLDTLVTPPPGEESLAPETRPSEGGHTFRHINVGHRERAASVAAGAALVALGLLRGRLGGLALAGLGALVLKRGVDGHCDLYQSLGINTALRDEPDPTMLYERGVKIYETIIVSRRASELYDFWRDFENHPRFMPNVDAVHDHRDGRSTWRLRGPAGITVEYNAEIINDEPGRLIAWRSVAGTDIQHAGSVRFIEAPGGGTEVLVNVEYVPPAGHVGRFGSTVLRMLGKSPRDDVREGLRNFKRLMESGESR